MSLRDCFLKVRCFRKPLLSQKQGGSIYSPLDQQRLEIRLLTILPGQQNDPLVCTLHVVSLEDIERFRDSNPAAFCFDALSYVWGDPNPSRFITVNGEKVSVGENLETALQYLRNIQGSPIWIDALCIDQSDIAERNHQVQTVMPLVYSKAIHVRVWLGSPDDESNNLMKYLIETLPPPSWARITDWEEEELRKLAQAGAWIQNLLNRPWWTRTWVVQEYFFAEKDPIVGCGIFWVESCRLRLFLKHYTAFLRRCEEDRLASPTNAPMSPKLLEFEMNRSGFDLMHEFRETKHSILSTPREFRRLVTVLFLVLGRSCTDPRDQVYASLGVLGLKDQNYVQVDYRKPVRVVYREFMEALIRHGSINELAVFSFSVSRLQKSPSWVPDLTRQLPFGPYSPLSILLSGETFQGAKSNLAELKGSILSLQGLLVDEITALAVDLDIEDDFQPTLRKLEQFAMDAMRNEIPKDHHLACLNPQKTQTEPWDVILPERIKNYYLTARHKKRIWCKLTGLPDDIGVQMNSCYHPRDPYNLWKGAEESTFWEVKDQLRRLLPGRTCFTTKLGFFGVGTPAVRVGDVVTFLFGSQLPTILRYTPRRNRYTMVDVAYLAGLEVEKLNEQYKAGMFRSLQRTFKII